MDVSAIDTPKMTLTKLPLEILHQIFFFVPSPQDLSSIRLSSRLLALAAQRALFRHVDFSSRPARLQTLFLLLRLISLRPDLAGHVRSLEIAYIPGMRRRFVPGCNRAMFRALKSMTRLTRLHVVIQSPDDVSNLAQCTFRLKALGITSSGPVQLEPLFRAQAEVEEITLRLPWIDLSARDTVKDLGRDLLPKLHTVHAHWYVALEIVPERPVEHVDLFDRWSVLDIGRLEHIVPRLGTSSMPLRSFSARIACLDEDVLKLFNNYLPCLVDLDLVIAKSDGSDALTAIDNLVSTQASHCLSSLSSLSLSSTRWRTLASPSYEPLLERIGTACPSLGQICLSAEVVIAHDPPLEGSVTFRRNWGWGGRREAEMGLRMWCREEAFEEVKMLRIS